jgi:predicted RNA binding protein YcfA (HicA-like mRNA interferase family)
MRRLPSLSSRQIIQALRKAGFTEAPKRGKGSHMAFTKENPKDVRLVIVPKGKDIPRGTLRSILEQAGLNRDEFLNLL